MKLKGRLGASVVLILVLASTVGLFYYANQFKKASVQTLQTKLQEMEMQRLEEEKGKQALAAAQKAAERFDQFVEQIQKKTEAAADNSALRQPHGKPLLRKSKEKSFQQIMRADALGSGAVLTDEKGEIIAATGGIAATSLAGTPEFREVSRQRMTALRLIEKREQDVVLQVTVPCLGNTGEFLGVLQAETALTPAVLEQVFPQGGLISMLGTRSGRRLTAVSPEGFPNHLGALMGKNPQQWNHIFHK